MVNSFERESERESTIELSRSEGSLCVRLLLAWGGAAVHNCSEVSS